MASSAVRPVLEAYLGGRADATAVVVATAVAYYGDGGRGRGTRAALRPLIDVIDRASPGVVELGAVSGASGFEIRLAERPFPAQYEADLRRAVEAALAGLPPMEGPAAPRLLRRVLGAIQRLLSA